MSEILTYIDGGGGRGERKHALAYLQNFTRAYFYKVFNQEFKKFDAYLFEMLCLACYGVLCNDLS